MSDDLRDDVDMLWEAYEARCDAHMAQVERAERAEAEVERLTTRLKDLVVIDEVWAKHRAECHDDPCMSCQVMATTESEAYRLARAALDSPEPSR